LETTSYLRLHTFSKRDAGRPRGYAPTAIAKNYYHKKGIEFDIYNIIFFHDMTFPDMKQINKQLLIFIISLLSIYYAHATHIIGGEINYRCLGNNKYQISLTVYRDCFYGVPPFDPFASIGIFSKD
jgi:hypothetical protein